MGRSDQDEPDAGVHHGVMRAHRERHVVNPRIPASRAAHVAGTCRWYGTLETAVPAAAASPAQIRAMTFAAALGPDRAPFSAERKPAEDDTIDLAGEEALLAYLARLAPSNA